MEHNTPSEFNSAYGHSRDGYQWQSPSTQSMNRAISAPVERVVEVPKVVHTNSYPQAGPASQTSNPPGTKAKRKRASAQQLYLLSRIFECTYFPSTELRLALGQELCMTQRTVQIWFQNKRQALRHSKSNSEDHISSDNERGAWDIFHEWQHSRTDEFEWSSSSAPLSPESLVSPSLPNYNRFPQPPSMPSPISPDFNQTSFKEVYKEDYKEPVGLGIQPFNYSGYSIPQYPATYNPRFPHQEKY